jgi:hypothetical protein
VSEENDDKTPGPAGENPDGDKSVPSSTPAEPPRFWGSPSAQKPIDPAEFGVGSSSNAPEDTTPAWIQSSSPADPTPATPPPFSSQDSPGVPNAASHSAESGTPGAPTPDGWQGSAPPPVPPQQPQGPPNDFNNGVPVFQPPSASGRKRRFELRPFTVADILDLTFQLMKANWKPLGALALVYALPAGVLTAISNSVAADENQGGNVLGEALPFLSGVGAEVTGFDLVVVLITSVLSLGLTVLLQPLVQGAITRSVAATFVGRDMGAKEAFNGVKHLWLVFIGATILTTLALIGGLIVFLVGIIIAAVLFAAVIPIIAIEEESVFNAMGRSWALMKRGFWRYLGVLVVMFILTMIIAFAVVLIPQLIAGALYDANLDPIAFVFDAFGSTLSEVIAFPISAIVATLIYFDARVRFEGFDVQLMAARLPQNQTPPASDGPGHI